MDLQFPLGLLLGFVMGILASILAGLRLSFLQFKYSTAGFRVQSVAEATNQFANRSNNTSTLRDKYRYSLGVIIDELQNWPKDNTQFPLVAQLSGDRWQRFHNDIRPVINDVNVYAFVSSFRLPFFRVLFDVKLVKQLGTLVKLLNQLEQITAEIDAAFEIKAIEETDGKLRLTQQDTSLQANFAQLRKTWGSLGISGVAVRKIVGSLPNQELSVERDEKY